MRCCVAIDLAFIKCDVYLVHYNLRGTSRFRENPRGFANHHQNYENNKPHGFEEVNHEVPRGLLPKYDQNYAFRIAQNILRYTCLEVGQIFLKT